MNLKNFVFIAILLLVCKISASQIVDVEVASKVAKNFYYEKINQIKPENFKNVKVEEAFVIKESNKVLYYVFNLKNNGYIVVSAEYRTWPVLAYSFENSYSLLNHPPAFEFWMNSYKEQIVNVRKSSLKVNTDISDAWNRLSNEDFNSNQIFKSKAVSPMLFTTWDQSPYYNDACPADSLGPGGNAVAGCVPIAMAQIMNYYRYPQQGIGSYSYVEPDYGTLSADFANTTYRWDYMPLELTGSNLYAAEIIYHLGVAVDLDYGPQGSGMYNHKIAYAVRTNFGYDPTTEYLFRDSTTMNWKQQVLSHLDNKMPLYYAGWADTTFTSGHAFVCDGYQDTSYFHFNWGWGGSYDGYFMLDNLTPGGADFKKCHELVVNMYPTTNYPYYCNGTTTLTNKEGTIEDGSGPIDDYQNMSDCKWLITPTDSVVSISLEFLKFDLEDGVDYLTVYDGETTNDPIIGTFTGNSVPAIFNSTSDKMLIRFTSDGANTAPGFLAEYKSVKAVFCSGTKTLSAPSGIVSDGSGSALYNENSICFWKINPPNVESVTLTFTSFDLEPVNDFVKIYRMSDNTVIGQYSGNTFPSQITVDGAIKIFFRSNFAMAYQGWEATYTSVAVGVDENQFISNIEIFPNPANELVNINFDLSEPQNVMLSISSVTGEIIFTDEIESIEKYNKVIDISNFAKGIYFLSIESDKSIINRKIIVK